MKTFISPYVIPGMIEQKEYVRTAFQRLERSQSNARPVRVPVALMEKISAPILKLWDFTLEEVKAKGNGNILFECRASISYWLLFAGAKRKQIAKFVNRDRSSVYNMVKRYNEMIEVDKRFIELHLDMKSKILDIVKPA